MNIINVFNKLIFKTKVYSPEILIGVGISAGIAAIVSACKGTMKANDILVPAHERIQDIKKYIPVEQQEEKIKEVKKEITPKLIKAYVPTAIFAGMSASCILGSFHIQKGRELAVATAYAALKDTFDSYRSRVEEKYGEEAEKDLYFGKNKKEVVVGHDKDGKPVTKIEYDYKNDPNNFTYLFDESNINWTADARENAYALATIQANLNNRLKRRGHVFLYEVYKALGIDPGILGPERVRAAHVIGWLYDPDNPNGDNYIDFGVFQDDRGNLTQSNYERIMKFGEPNIWLEFNPDGDILTGNNGKRVFTETARGL